MVPFFLLLFLLCFPNFVILLSPYPLVLLISFDGFRYDFLNQTTTPNLWKLGMNGVRFSKGIRSQYLTVTAPNHYSIVTGLYQESHGIVGNNFYDPLIGDVYDLWDTENMTRYNNSKNGFWYNGIPIWLTNQHASDANSKTQRLSGALDWPSCDANFSGEYPYHWRTWTENYNLTKWKSDFDTILEWFTHPQYPINLALLYISQPDEVLHHFGFSKEFNGNITSLDQLVGYMIERMTKLGLIDKINIIMTADHGHVQLKEKSEYQTLSFCDLINCDDVIHCNFGLLPASEKTDMNAIYETLLKASTSGRLPAKIFKKEDIPDVYHYKNSPRIGDIIIDRELGYNVHFNNTWEKGDPLTSDHAFDPQEILMRPFFLVHGPAFDRQVVIEDENIENIDIYPLMCHILGITPLPNNGSLDRIAKVLRPNGKGMNFVDLSHFWSFSDKKLIIVVVLAIFVPGLYLLCYMIVCVIGTSNRNRNMGPNRGLGYVILANQRTANGAHVSGEFGNLVSESEDEL